jgi:hypothetical protein
MSSHTEATELDVSPSPGKGSSFFDVLKVVSVV